MHFLPENPQQIRDEEKKKIILRKVRKLAKVFFSHLVFVAFKKKTKKERNERERMTDEQKMTNEWKKTHNEQLETRKWLTQNEHGVSVARECVVCHCSLGVRECLRIMNC